MQEGTCNGVGGYSEYINVPAASVVAAPAHLDPAERVAIVCNYLTAYQLLHRIARIRLGERILIHSAGGGVGTALLQLGQLAKQEMYGTVSAGKFATPDLATTCLQWERVYRQMVR